MERARDGWGRAARGVAAAVALAATPAEAAERLEISPWLDGGIAAGTVGLWVGLTQAAPEAARLARPPLDPPGGIDAWGRHRLHEDWLRPSDGILVAALAGGGALTLIDGLRDGNALAHGVIFLEALLVNGMATESTKQLVLRARPYTYDAPTREADDRHSFFSGHTSWTATASFAAARIFDLSGDLDAWERVALYGSATALTAGVGAARVAAGMHFPSDVLVGGLVGTTIGLAVPELHRPGGLVFGAGASPGGAQLTLSGTL